MENNKDNAKKSLPQSENVCGFEVRKLNLEDYIFALEKVENVFSVFKDFDKIDETTILSNIGKIVSKALPDVAEVLAIATKCEIGIIKSQDALTIIKLIKAFFNVNDFFLVIEEIKSIKLKK